MRSISENLLVTMNVIRLYQQVVPAPTSGWSKQQEEAGGHTSVSSAFMLHVSLLQDPVLRHTMQRVAFF